ncbi:MAG: hypothetical protein U1E65_04920 [Myxococcota bacterium]
MRLKPEHPDLSIERLRQSSETLALAEALAAANGGKDVFRFKDALQLAPDALASYATLLGSSQVAAYTVPSETSPKAKKPPPAALAALSALESGSLADQISQAIHAKPGAQKAVNAYLKGLGPMPEAVEINGQDRYQLFGAACTAAQQAPGPLSKLLIKWLMDSIHDTSAQTELSDPKYPRDLIRVARWLTGDASAPAPADAAKLASPAAEALIQVFAQAKSPELTARVRDYLLGHPAEVPALQAYFDLQGAPDGGSALSNEARKKLIVEANLLLSGAGTTYEGKKFPSKGLGTLLNTWIFDNYPAYWVKPSDAAYPWPLISLCEWLLSGEAKKGLHDFNAMIGDVLGPLPRRGST